LKVGKARLRLYLRAVIGAALLGWLAHRTGFGLGVLAAPGRTLAAVGATSVLLATGQALSAWRWQLLLGPDAPGWLDLCRVYLIGQFAGLFLPTSVGGDVVRIAAVSRVRPAGLTLSSVLLDRGLGLLALCVFFVIGAFLAPAQAAGWSDRLQLGASPSRWIAAGALGALLLLFLAPFQPSAACAPSLARRSGRWLGRSAVIRAPPQPPYSCRSSCRAPTCWRGARPARARGSCSPWSSCSSPCRW
jgi:hypothetical protein